MAADADSTPLKSFSLEDVAPHSSEKDCWLVIHGKVYDVTQFLDEHPGGYDIVVSNSGEERKSLHQAVRASRSFTLHPLEFSRQGRDGGL